MSTNFFGFKTKKNKSSSLYVNLFYYFLIFILVLIILLLLFQVYLLPLTYRFSRYKQVSQTGKTIASSEFEITDQSSIDDLTIGNNVTAIVIDVTDSTYYISNEYVFQSLLNKFDLKMLISQISSDNFTGERILYVNSNGTQILDLPSIMNKYSKEISGEMYVNRFTNADNIDYIVLVLGSIVPVESTLTTIRAQILQISVLLVVISLFVSFISSKEIAKPITKITESAKQLAQGNYSAKFEVEGYSEVEDLSNTLNEMARQLEKADALQKELIANMSHDLRTPLTMISGYGELIRDIPSENTPENVQVIIDEANRLASLVNNLLDISKLQSGTDSISLSIMNINEMVYSVYTSYQKMVSQKGYDIQLEMSDDNYYVNGDSIRLQQVLHNLMNNAINHCGEDKKVIIRCQKVDKNIRIDVIDHGAGIAKEDQPLIWKRYYKADKSKRYQSGSGLGLSIVKTILDMHKANYGVESELGKGSDFYFELPIVEN